MKKNFKFLSEVFCLLISEIFVLGANTLHSRNKHFRYDFDVLIRNVPELSKFVSLNKWNTETLDFSNPLAVKILNKSLLKSYYKVDYWDIPKNHLCPAVPGRADYIHHISDLLSDWDGKKIPYGTCIHGLDIGTGANGIYPLIGIAEYGWNFTGTDINIDALNNVKKIIQENPHLSNKFDLILQPNSNNIFCNIINNNNKYDFSMCNPPFHSSAEEAKQGTIRKLKGLGLNNNKIIPIKNFEGIKLEM